MIRDELFPGRKVIIFDWESEGFDRPEHWNEEGEMDGWCGQVVTIVEIIGFSVSIKEDGGDWEWYPEDFEPYDDLSADNPNIRFVQLSRDRVLEELRKELADDIKRMKWRGGPK